MADAPEEAAAASLSEVVTRINARAVKAAGLRPCYKYAARWPEQSFGGLGAQLCYSDALFRSAPAARHYLGLPYEPVCRLALSHAQWEAFASSGASRRRAWAAFGVPGGAFEMASSARFQQLELRGVAAAGAHSSTESWLLDELLPAGGGDADCVSCPGQEPGGLLDLVQLLAATAAEFSRSLREDGEAAAWKLSDDAVAAAVVYGQREPHEYTLSVAARLHGDYLAGLRFWAVLWRDDERRAVRQLARPIELQAPGVIVARLDELAPYSAQSARLMTIIWEQFSALRQLTVQKNAAECTSEFVEHRLLP
jgi:hypothetical protein